MNRTALALEVLRSVECIRGNFGLLGGYQCAYCFAHTIGGKPTHADDCKLDKALRMEVSPELLVQEILAEPNWIAAIVLLMDSGALDRVYGPWRDQDGRGSHRPSVFDGFGISITRKEASRRCPSCAFTAAGDCKYCPNCGLQKSVPPDMWASVVDGVQVENTDINTVKAEVDRLILAGGGYISNHAS